MIVRIVKMTFIPERTEEFLQFFEDYKNKIRNFPGCHYLLILRDKNHPHIVFSYSHWNREEDLDNYRHSDLFKKVWPKTKELFLAAPEAWTTEILHDLI
jgi:(4S)-4-hydroxy-5-phosphonooxypentane-2,3-dione isomerase